MLLELFFEIFCQGLADISGNPKIPLFIRLLLFTVLCSIPTTVSVLGIFVSYKATGMVGSVICGIISALLIALWVFGCYKIIKHKPTK